MWGASLKQKYYADTHLVKNNVIVCKVDELNCLWPVGTTYTRHAEGKDHGRIH